MKARNVWGLTGTPVTSSLDELKNVALALGHWRSGLNLRQYVKCVGKDCSGSHTLLRQNLVTTLRKLMIRHTKAQRINGTEALALPALEAQTVWLTMSRDEKHKYKCASWPMNFTGNVAAFRLEMGEWARSCSLLAVWVLPAG